MKVFVINLETEEVDGPTVVRVNAGETVKEFKISLANLLNMDANIIKVCFSDLMNRLRRNVHLLKLHGFAYFSI